MTKFNILYLLTPLLLLISSGCSGGKDFKIDVESVSDSNRMLTLTFTDSHNGIRQLTAPIDNHKASFSGENPEWTPAYLSWTTGEPIATLIVRNGDRIKVVIPEDASAAPQIKGSKATLRLSDFRNSHNLANDALIPDSLNSRIVEYLRRNPDDPVSTLLLTDYFMCIGHEAEADSLLQLIDENARPASMLHNFGTVNSRTLAFSPERVYNFAVYSATDSFITVRPTRNKRTLVALLSTIPSERSAQVRQLKALRNKADSAKWQIVELSFAADSAQWRASIASDSAFWLQSWNPGGAGAPQLRRFDIPRHPFFIMIDSAGNQAYRGSDLNAALDAMSRPSSIK